jgi:hypothetical protein
LRVSRLAQGGAVHIETWGAAVDLRYPGADHFDKYAIDS